MKDKMVSVNKERMRDKLQALSDYLYKIDRIDKGNGLLAIDCWSIKEKCNNFAKKLKPKAVLLYAKSIDKYGFYIQAEIDGVLRVYTPTSFTAYMLSIVCRIIDLEDYYTVDIAEQIEFMCLDILGLQKVGE